MRTRASPPRQTSSQPLGVEPLGGDLFDSNALAPLASATLDNVTLLGCLRSLSVFRSPDTRQPMRVNYAALNVEEFGSVYQGLLEFEPRASEAGGRWTFAFTAGGKRSRTGSHYTPEEPVQPLLKHSLDHLLAEQLTAARDVAGRDWRTVDGKWQTLFRTAIHGTEADLSATWRSLPSRYPPATPGSPPRRS